MIQKFPEDQYRVLLQDRFAQRLLAFGNGEYCRNYLSNYDTKFLKPGQTIALVKIEVLVEGPDYEYLVTDQELKPEHEAQIRRDVLAQITLDHPLLPSYRYQRKVGNVRALQMLRKDVVDAALHGDMTIDEAVRVVEKRMAVDLDGE